MTNAADPFLLNELLMFVTRVYRDERVSETYEDLPAPLDEASDDVVLDEQPRRYRLPSSHLDAAQMRDTIVTMKTYSPSLINSDDQLYLDVYAWIAAVAGDDNVHLHDIILLPMQASMPNLRRSLANVGYDVDAQFVTAECTNRLFHHILQHVDTNVATYIALVMNVTVKPFGQFGLNVAHAMLPRRWTIHDPPPSTSWKAPVWYMHEADVMVPVHALDVDAPLEEPLVYFSEYCSLSDEHGIFVNLLGEEHDDQSHDAVHHQGVLFLVLMTVTDPVVIVKQLWNLFDRMDEEHVAFIVRFRQKLVKQIWPSSGHCLKDVLAMHTQWLRLSPPSSCDTVDSRLVKLVCKIVEFELLGPIPVLIDSVSSFVDPGQDWELYSLLSFACIASRLGSSSLLRLAKYDTFEFANYLAMAMRVWRGQIAVHPLLPIWGCDVLFDGLVETFGREVSDAIMSVMHDLVPNGKIPKRWIDSVLTSTDYSQFLIPMCKTLMHYGLFDPKSTLLVDEQLDARMYLSEWCAIGHREDVGALLRFALKVGSPRPRMDVVRQWWPEDAYAAWKSIELEMSRR